MDSTLLLNYMPGKTRENEDQDINTRKLQKVGNEIYCYLYLIDVY